MSQAFAACPSCRGSVPCLDDGSPPRFCTFCNVRMAGAPVASGAESAGEATKAGPPSPVADASADPSAARIAAALARAAEASARTPGADSIVKLDAASGDPAPDWKAPDTSREPEGLLPIPEALAGRLGLADVSQPAPEPVIPVQSCCEDLDVRFNRARVCIQGAIMRFEFEIRALTDGVSDLVCEMSGGGQSGTIDSARCSGGLPRGKRWSPMINHAPHAYGCPAFTLHIAYRRNGPRRWFEAQFPCRIYPNTANAKDVIDQQVTNLNLEIKADRGSIVDLGNALTYLGQLKKDVGGQESLGQMLDRIERIPPAMTPLELFPGSRGDEGEDRDASLPSMPAAARAEALTLEAGGWKVHVLAHASLQMGRNKQADIMTRIFEADGGASKSRNDHISRYHARIDLHGDRCFLVDVGRDPETGVERESACGTYVDRQRVAPRRHAELAVGVKSRIGLGGPCGSGPNVFEFDALPWTCGMMAGSDCPLESRCPPGAPSCLFLRRTDSVHEIFAVVWKCCPMVNVSPEFDGLHVWRQGGGFAWRLGRRKGWLASGETIRDGQREISVGPYRQLGK